MFPAQRHLTDAGDNSFSADICLLHIPPVFAFHLLRHKLPTCDRRWATVSRKLGFYDKVLFDLQNDQHMWSLARNTCLACDVIGFTVSILSSRAT